MDIKKTVSNPNITDVSLSFLNNNEGYLELIIGPMYAGKSTELIRLINRYKCFRDSRYRRKSKYNKYNTTNN